MLKPVEFRDDKLIVLDQTLLPGEERYIELNTPEEVFDAIKTLKVRGAPAIGVVAAFGIYVVTKDVENDEFSERFIEVSEYIKEARPTAVNLSASVDRMMRCYHEKGRSALLDEAMDMLNEDLLSGERMAKYGLSLLKPGMRILTHCNAGKLATAGNGTCLAPIYLGNKEGYDFKVYADETRPLLQGGRLTAWELNKEGIDVTVLCDSMAASLMKKREIDAIVVGCDRLAANGDGANKIGTLNLGILAEEFNIPFYMFVPESTIDMNTETGDEIKIEMRDESEVGEMWYQSRMIPVGVKSYNPSFDVTDNKYITAIITDRGIVHPPFDVNLSKMFG